MYVYHYTYGVGRPPWALGVPWDRPEVTMRAHDMLEHPQRLPAFRLLLPGGCFQKNTKKVTRAAFPAAARRELSFIMSLDVNFLMVYVWGPSKHITSHSCFSPVF